MKIYRLLLAAYITLFILCAISPYDRTVWFSENLPIVILVIFIAFASRHYRFSNISYFCMFALPLLHTIGGHYTFERVPFDFITDTFGFERNHYDRIAHFSVGFYAYPIAEFLLKRGVVVNRAAVSIYAVCVIFTVASVYEIFEWIYAISADPSAGLAVLGSQGDIWDAQKDMLADGLGALFAMISFNLIERDKSKS